jgi:hypothetical protein
MPRFAFATSTLLTISGICLAIIGIAAEEWKPIAVGLVLILAAGVFARLYRGTRKSPEAAGLHNRQF